LVTWNAKDLLRLEDIVKAIRDEMGLDEYYVACSNFVLSDGDNRGAFEVAIISKYPLSDITEYDPFPEAEDDPGMTEVEIVPLTQYGIVDIGTSRGFLMAKIPDFNLYVGVTHLKSSLGYVGIPDASNAVKRELVAAYKAKTVNDLTDQEPDARFFIGGDFNVGHSDNLKNGTNLLEDCYDPDECPGADLYDETHALLGGGLIDGLLMTNQTLSITETTFPEYPGSPIDNIYVLWKGEGDVGQAVRVNQTFGSDHVPVYVDFTWSE
jgi:endonuclease/exonuclease/phosphatase family metal-dependent hydrolase